MKHFSKKLLPYYILLNFLICIGIYAVVLFDLYLDEEISIETITIWSKYCFVFMIVLFVVLCIYRFFFYKTSGYKLTDKGVVCTIGVLFRKESIVEYERIHAINKKQGLIQQMFNIAVLSIDSGSTNTSHTAEIKIFEESSIIDELIENIKKYQNKEQEVEKVSSKEESVYKFDRNKKFSYCLFNICTVIVTVLIGYLLLFLINLVLHFINEEIVIYLLIGLSIAIVLVFIGSLIAVFIGYYDFTLKKSKDSISISYGLFVKHNNTFKYNRIKAVRIHQSIIKRIFGFVELTIDVIGYGEYTNENGKEVDSKGVLVPLCKLSEVNGIIEEILPDYVPDEKEYKSISYFSYTNIPFVSISIITGLVLLCVNIYFIYFNRIDLVLISSIIICIVFIITTLLLLFLQEFHYCNNGLTIKDNKITLYRGGLFKETVVILKENIISIETITTKQRDKKNIYTFIIHYKNNSDRNTIKVKNVNKDLKEQLFELLVY